MLSMADAAIHQLFEANRLMREAGERIASAAGQTHARRMVLQAALAVEPAATVPDIARRLGLHRQGVQRIADELVTEGLGRYDDNPRHRVSKLFVVTDRGRAALAAIGREHASWIDGIEAEATGIDWPRLRDDLSLLVQILRDRE
ncbi:MarR family winged helix-turn-helix transcriptional regulator [Virgisporangium aurantiacum]|uniref:MarR family transcriptional regulator n=1 Tax=Virgisporangium aurantiacum TaxID=175570 RepID=A0A8J3ZEF5_9ACTN|nr:MarR family transcriptional regulator [Virgisporangium aurantiacum]GIJ61293.1 MarR family transcriptional regulator [Virgisporangium aurantiacum]